VRKCRRCHIRFYVKTRPSRKLLILFALNSLFSAHSPSPLRTFSRILPVFRTCPFLAASLRAPRRRRRTAVLSTNHVLDGMRWRLVHQVSKPSFSMRYSRGKVFPSTPAATDNLLPSSSGLVYAHTPLLTFVTDFLNNKSYDITQDMSRCCGFFL